ncbi:hypothetical protein SLEP1_g48061 [Rubroshorea leprosula]|uniref:Uncharacterized protein n=1 Tax=Rubroshorea leprosula TaxID=152421 RepID=A0AAV5LTD9_9ROSI|nr:hypothetical protein SLEP1_g48061 [Rubroshorea leprosula]
MLLLEILKAEYTGTGRELEAFRARICCAELFQYFCCVFFTVTTNLCSSLLQCKIAKSKSLFHLFRKGKDITQPSSVFTVSCFLPINLKQ